MFNFRFYKTKEQENENNNTFAKEFKILLDINQKIILLDH